MDRTGPAPERAWRGHSRCFPDLPTSLHRIIRAASHSVIPSGFETRAIVAFKSRAWEHLSRVEQQYFLNDSQGTTFDAFLVMQHYGAPTRLLDWSRSPWAALYFAVIDSPEADGEIWTFNVGALHDILKARAWSGLDLPRMRDSEHIDLTAAVFRGPARRWIAPLYSRIVFPRLEAQNGMFTVAGVIDVPHDELLGELLEPQHRERIVIPREFKSQLLHTLTAMGLHSRTLLYPGADFAAQSVVRDMQAELHAHRPGFVPGA